MKKIVVLLWCGLMAVALAGCGSDNDKSPASVPSGSSEVPSATKISIDNFAYDPAEVTTKPGETVIVANADSASHTLTLDDGSAKTGTVAPGENKSIVSPDKAGAYKFHCEIHATMTGTLTVE